MGYAGRLRFAHPPANPPYRTYFSGSNTET